MKKKNIILLLFIILLTFMIIGCQKKEQHKFYTYEKEGEVLLFEFVSKEKGTLYSEYAKGKEDFELKRYKQNHYTIVIKGKNEDHGINSPRIRFEGDEMYFLKMGIDWDSNKVVKEVKAKKISSKEGEKGKKKVEEAIKKEEKEYEDKEKETIQKIKSKKKEMEINFQVLKDKIKELDKKRKTMVEKNKNIEKILEKELKELKAKSKEEDTSSFVRTLFITNEIRKKEFIDYTNQVMQAEKGGDLKELETDFMYIEKNGVEILELIYSLQNKSIQEKEKSTFEKYQEKMRQELDVEYKKAKVDMEQIRKEIIPLYEKHTSELERMKYEAEKLQY